MPNTMRMGDASVLRGQLADRLRREGVLRDSDVERAVRRVPRHLFSPETPLELAYDDRVIRLKEADGILISSLSQPAMIVEMLQQLEVRPGDRVLEIGTGSGYTAALLGELTGPKGSVVSIDLEADLVAAANDRFAGLGLSHVWAFTGDGSQGDAAHAPFDRILLTVCATDIEAAWWDQLARGGRIVLPLSFNGVQKSIAFVENDGILRSDGAIDCGFVMVRGAAKTEQMLRLSSDPEFFLSTESAANIDPVALTDRLLNEEPIWQRLSQPFAAKDFYAGATLWLAVHDRRFCRLETSGERTQRMPTLLVPVAGSRLTIGLCERDAIALLGFRLEANPRAQALFVATYGPARGLEDRLDSLLLQWERAGRPGRRGLEVTAVRAGMRIPPHEITVVVQRPATTFFLLMC